MFCEEKKEKLYYFVENIILFRAMAKRYVFIEVCLRNEQCRGWWMV